MKGHMGVKASKALRWKEEVAEMDKLRSLREKPNREFFQRKVLSVKKLTNGLLPNLPTNEQDCTIATDEDVRLVLANAGKTAVIMGKMEYQVKN